MVNAFVLRGSVGTIVEYFELAIHSILYHRAIYPSEDFKPTKKYGIHVMMSTHPDLLDYLEQIIPQINKWFLQKKICQLVLVISSRDTREVLERWQFQIDIQQGHSDTTLKNDIATVMRQITASISYLPILSEPCTFNVLAYTDTDAEVPRDWIDSDARQIDHPERVQFKSFSTGIHQVETMVSYKLSEK